MLDPREEWGDGQSPHAQGESEEDRSPRGIADPAAVAALLGAALRAAGIPAGTGRCERFARAITVLQPREVSLDTVHSAGLATLVSGPEQIGTFERVFAALFGGSIAPQQVTVEQEIVCGLDQGDEGGPGDQETVVTYLASATERLRNRDFGELTDDELRRLAGLMRELVIAVPPRVTRRYAPSRRGDRPDLRRTLRQARRTGGEPVRLAWRRARVKPRRLVVLCDISGSMEPYARALLQLLYCAARTGTEVFSFATRLTRLTRELGAATPETMLVRAGEAAPDWSSGTMIGACLREFNQRYGAKARGAVVLIASDGWETGDPALVGTQMARLSRLAYRIVWANPRTASDRYRPEVGGMAAAWPYCDAVVSAHNFDALDGLLAALRE
jgi:uncharacterized protein with von Willebrand factor type A (vWA) domain